MTVVTTHKTFGESPRLGKYCALAFKTARQPLIWELIWVGKWLFSFAVFQTLSQLGGWQTCRLSVPEGDRVTVYSEGRSRWIELSGW